MRAIEATRARLIDEIICRAKRKGALRNEETNTMTDHDEDLFVLTFSSPFLLNLLNNFFLVDYIVQRQCGLTFFHSDFSMLEVSACLGCGLFTFCIGEETKKEVQAKVY
jgi:hypothetical protein